MSGWLAVAFVAPRLLLLEPAQHAPSPAAVSAVEAWVTAVARHAPGENDESVDLVHAMSFDARVDLNDGLPLFLAALKNPNPRLVASESAHTLGAIALEVAQRPGREIFLKRAAILHSDAAIYGQYGDPSTFSAAAEIASRAAAPTTPLLSNHQLTVDNDGQILGSVHADWNWPFARSLLDQLSPRPGRDPFVGAWYHATLAYMFQESLYGEMPPHLARAGVLLPDDARILFDQACYAEVLGLAKNQVLLSDDDVSQLEIRARRVPGASGSGPTHLGIPLAEMTNENAERLFRRVLRVDPAFVEARVRLARLLTLRKRYDEADAELATALAAKPAGDLAYYAHLFAGRTAQALGRIDAATAHAEDALAIAPGAQSALLARSQAALLGADVQGTVGPLEQLRGRTQEVFDPWRDYPLGPGRDADSLLDQVWAMVPGRPGKA